MSRNWKRGFDIRTDTMVIAIKKVENALLVNYLHSMWINLPKLPEILEERRGIDDTDL